MHHTVLGLRLLVGGEGAGERRVQSPPPAATAKATIYQLRHSLKVNDIPPGAKKVRIWVWFPDDDPYQKILQYGVPEAAGKYQLTRDGAHGHRYLYTEVDNPDNNPISLTTEFVLCRLGAAVPLDPKKAGP